MLQAPPSEMQEIISISAQGTKRELANALGIQEVIGPGDFVLLVVDQAVGRSAGGKGRSMNQLPMKLLQSTLRVGIFSHGISGQKLTIDARLIVLRQLLQHIATFVDLTALDQRRLS